MNAGRFVGRVGGLAVVLGVGVVMTFGASPAKADSTDSTTGSASSSATTKAAPTKRSAKHAVRPPTSAETISSPAPDQPKRSPSPGPTKRRGAQGAPSASTDAKTTEIKRPATEFAVVTKPASVIPPKPVTAAKPAPVAALSTPSMVPVASGAVSVGASPHSVVSSTATTASGVLAALFGGSGAPVSNPVAWVLTAVSRRELGARSTSAVAVAAAPTAASTNSLPVSAPPTVHDPDPLTGVVVGSLHATDFDGDALTYALSTNAKKGIASVDAHGNFSYTPTPAARHAASATTASASAKIDTFTVKISDGQGGSVSQTVTVPVSAANSKPVATTALTITNTNTSTGVVTGKLTITDADNDSFTYVGTAANGKVSIKSDGTVTYTPTATARHAASAQGAAPSVKTDTVTVTATDGHGGSVTQSMTVPITEKNAAPGPATAKAGKADATTGAVTGTVKATDKDKDSLSYATTAMSTKGGTVSIDATTGAFVYTPTAAIRHAAAVTGAPTSAKTDTFDVTINDGHNGTTTKTVTVSISPTNDAPVKGTASVGNPSGTTGAVSGNLNVSDINGDTLVPSTSVKPKKGQVVVSADGSFVYTPNAAAMHAASVPNASLSSTTDTFTVKVSDGHGGSVNQVVTVPIKATNTAPTVTGHLVMTTTNSSTGVMTGKITAADADNDSLKYTGTATKGTVTVNSSGTVTYTPSAAARHAASADGAPTSANTDVVTVTVSDGHNGSVTQSMYVSITGKNTAPTLTVTVGKPNATTGVVTGTVKGSDPDKDILTFSAETTSTKDATITIDPHTGAFTYTPSIGTRDAAATDWAIDAKNDYFTVTAFDGHGGSAEKIVNVAVSPQDASKSKVTVSASSLLAKLREKLPTPDTIYTESIATKDGTKLVVYMTGIAGMPKWYSAFNDVASDISSAYPNVAGQAYTAASNYINSVIEAVHPVSIMLVGHSDGGQNMQAYAATGKYKSLVQQVVTFASPIIKTVDDYSPGTSILNIQNVNDPVPTLFNHPDAVDSYADLGTEINEIVAAPGGHGYITMSYGASDPDGTGSADAKWTSKLIFRVHGNDALSSVLIYPQTHFVENYASAAEAFDAYAQPDYPGTVSKVGFNTGFFYDAAYYTRNRINAFSGTITGTTSYQIHFL